MRFVWPKWSRAVKIATLGIVLLPFESMESSLPTPPQPVTLVFLFNDWEIPDRVPGSDQRLEEFTRETGIHVRLLPPPEGALNELALWREFLQKGSPAPDVYGIDVIWAQMLSDYFVDLKPYLGAELSATDPVLIRSYSAGDKLVAMPYLTNVGVLLYRADLLQKYGYKAPPKTWDELEKMAARIQAGERANGKKDFWGYVWQGAAGEALTCNALEWQFAEGGGRIVEQDGTISVNNPNAIRAWQGAARWVGTISPPGVVAYREWDSANVWGSGNAAFHRIWESKARLAHLAATRDGDTVVGLGMGDKVGVTSLPSGSAGRAGTLGGSGLAISRFSAHPHEALEFVHYLLRMEVQNRQIRVERAASRQPQFYQLPAILEPDSLVADPSRRWDGIVFRPSVVASGKYEEVTKAYIEAVHSVLTRDRNAAEAAASLEKELIQITGFKKGPPVGEMNSGRNR